MRGEESDEAIAAAIEVHKFIRDFSAYVEHLRKGGHG